MKNKKVILTLCGTFLAFAMIFCCLGPAAFRAVEDNVSDSRVTSESDTTAESDTVSKDEVDSLGQRYSEKQKELNELKQKGKALRDKKRNASRQMNVVKDQIDILKNDISATSRALMKKQEELDNKKREIADTERLFKDRLKAMYIMRSGGTMSTILAVDSFSELLTATDTLQRISVADTELLKYLAQQKREIEIQEAEIQDDLNALVEKQGTLENKQAELAGLMQRIDRQMSDNEAMKRATQADRDALYREYKRAVQRFESSTGESYSDRYVGGEYIWPVPYGGYISSGYGPRSFYLKNGSYYSDFHNGIDITDGGIYGQKIVASNSGYVSRADYGSTGYGIVVEIDHGGGNFTIYGHCSSLAVSKGEYVNQGQVIAYVGNSGFSTGPHLHFGMRTPSGWIDPSTKVSH